MPTLAIALVFAGLAGTASAAEPQPDAAPQAPSVAPDPAPEATNSPAPQQSTPPPAQVAPQAPAAAQEPAAPAATPSVPAPRPASPKPKVEAKPARERSETSASRRPERRAEPADASRLLRVDAFLPGVQGDEDSPSHLVLLAAAALLALLMASGSLLSVATRVWPRQLR